MLVLVTYIAKQWVYILYIYTYRIEISPKYQLLVKLHTKWPQEEDKKRAFELEKLKIEAEAERAKIEAGKESERMKFEAEAKGQRSKPEKNQNA